jgi:hypothetical protein
MGLVAFQREEPSADGFDAIHWGFADVRDRWADALIFLAFERSHAAVDFLRYLGARQIAVEQPCIGHTCETP